MLNSRLSARGAEMNSELFEIVNQLATKKENEKKRKELIKKRKKKEKEKLKNDCILYVKFILGFAIVLATCDLLWWLASFWR